MLDYKDIIIKHYGLGMSGREIAKLLGISKSGVNDFLAAFKKCDTLSFPLPEGITNYAIANHVYGPPQPSHGRDAGFVLPDFEEIHKSMSSRKNMTLVYLWNDKLRKRRYPMNHRKMPSLSEMERIEQSLLGEKLDEMLDRIEKEDIAYVITEDGKDKLVLCPYRWFEENFPDDVGYVVNSAIRQELTAESENAEAVRQFIWNHYAAFDNRTLAVAVKDIDYYLTSSLFQAANAEEWRKLQAAFKSEINNREAQEGACP